MDKVKGHPGFMPFNSLGKSSSDKSPSVEQVTIVEKDKQNPIVVTN